MTIISWFLSPPFSYIPPFIFLPPFSVIALLSFYVQAFLFMVQGFYLPNMIPLWRQQARQKGEGKNLIKKRDHLMSTTSPAPAEFGQRQNTNS